ncbi:hypothetical protein [Paracoccus aminophilus]|nr:hypothetical protein [Paracoccus aminophilus]
MADLSGDDLKAAVAAGIVSEAQAASIQALAAQRLAGRPAPDDEAFELFRGFAEIFITAGLLILMAGLMGLASAAGDSLAFCLIGVVLSIGFARYFTVRRRMVLPSIVLVSAFALSVMGAILALLLEKTGFGSDLQRLELLAGGGMLLALVGWYWWFRLPFTMFLIGLAGLFLGVALIAPYDLISLTTAQSPAELLSLTGGSRLGLATLVVGLVAALGGIWFDTRDPYRLGRASASAFWLHLIAAPAIMNTLGQTAMALEGPGRLLAMALVLAVMTVFALIIDRRSFLTAGLGYLVWLIWTLAYRNGAGLDWPMVLVLIGGAVTALGAWWVPLRAVLMRALPDFPGKDRLPPYAKGAL